jgi:hypothetical protein
MYKQYTRNQPARMVMVMVMMMLLSLQSLSFASMPVQVTKNNNEQEEKNSLQPQSQVSENTVPHATLNAMSRKYHNERAYMYSASFFSRPCSSAYIVQIIVPASCIIASASALGYLLQPPV